VNLTGLKIQQSTPLSCVNTVSAHMLFLQVQLM